MPLSEDGGFCSCFSDHQIYTLPNLRSTRCLCQYGGAKASEYDGVICLLINIYNQNTMAITQKEISAMIRSQRLQLTYWQKISHYSIVFFLFALSVTPFVLNFFHGASIFSNEIIWFFVCFILAIMSFLFLKRRLKFRKIEIDYTDDQWNKTIERTAKELEWTIKNNNKNFFRAYREWNWESSWGEVITIIKLNDGFLVNSIGDPDKWGSDIFNTWNRKNIKIFLKHLSDVKNNISTEEDNKQQKQPENEWSLKRIGVRLFLYPFGLFVVALCVSMIILFNLRAMVSGSLGIALVGTIMYADVKLVLRQWRNRTK